jgi:hypothetical protein
LLYCHARHPKIIAITKVGKNTKIEALTAVAGIFMNGPMYLIAKEMAADATKTFKRKIKLRFIQITPANCFNYFKGLLGDCL